MPIVPHLPHAQQREPQDAARIEAIADQLPKLVADASRQERWKTAELLKRLGWRDIQVTRHQHTFPPDAYVQRNEATESALSAKIEQYTSGYISLLGSPGSGKSTLLQATVEPSSCLSVARYRGESTSSI